MTEHSFKEVVYQWGRMCEHHFCNSRDVKNQSLPMCPIALEHNGYPCDDAIVDLSEEAVKQVEEIVMNWAAANPEPSYPTWYCWLTMMGAITSSDDLFLDLQQPIPPNIAEKLGLKPKEGV